MNSLNATFPALKTDRLLIRPLEPRDVGARYLSWFGNHAVRHFIKAARDRQTLDTLREYVQTRRLSEKALLLGIFVRRTGRHIGNIKFEPIDTASRSTVLGVMIGERRWRGKGVFGEAFAALSPLLVERFGIERVTLGVDRQNVAAIKAYRKSSFRILARKAVRASANGNVHVVQMIWKAPETVSGRARVRKAFSIR